MLKAYQFRLRPTAHQRTLLRQTLDLCRWVYNETLATRKSTWEGEQKTLSLYDTNKLLTAWKQTKPELTQVHAQVLQNAQERVDLAFKAFFRRVKAGETPGYPRFRAATATIALRSSSPVLDCLSEDSCFPKSARCG
jgi:putative transposase